jgi:hypothetical protein
MSIFAWVSILIILFLLFPENIEDMFCLLILLVITFIQSRSPWF